MITNNMFRDVEACHKHFGLLVNKKPVHLTHRKLLERIHFLHEELNEFAQAAVTQNIFDQADALVDLVYVALGTGVMMGLPWEELWDDVQRANMSKTRGVGKRGHKVDLIKPVDWQPPKTEHILLMADYDLSDKINFNKHVDDEKEEV